MRPVWTPPAPKAGSCPILPRQWRRPPRIPAGAVPGFFFAVFSVNAFASLVVLDVLLNSLTLLLEFAALWMLPRTSPEIPRSKIPGGLVGGIIVTLLPAAVIIFSIVSQVKDVGWTSIWYAAIAIILGAIAYFPFKYYLKDKRNVPDVDPYTSDEDRAEMASTAGGSVWSVCL